MTLPPASTATGLRYAGAGAALAAAAIYMLIGFGIVSIGTAASGSAPDLLSFGLTMGIAFVVVSGLLLRYRSRALWLAIAALQMLVIGGYFALSEIRTPPVEVWGLVIKSFQAVVLVAASLLALRGTQEVIR